MAAEELCSYWSNFSIIVRLNVTSFFSFFFGSEDRFAVELCTLLLFHESM